MRRALESGKPAVINVVADCDGTEYSQAWLRLKSGDMYSRGLGHVGEDIRRHFEVSPLNALRIRKSAEDNGMHIPLAFIAQLTGTTEIELRKVAAERQYDLGGA
jgi:acetolactate synthase-1/2/3 large subunit